VHIGLYVSAWSGAWQLPISRYSTPCICFCKGRGGEEGWVPVWAVEMSLAALALDVCDAGLFGVFWSLSGLCGLSLV
jgi:hypothetical protein